MTIVVTAMTMVTTPKVTLVVTNMSVPAGMIQLVSQASPDRHGMPAAVTMPMLRMPQDRLSAAVMLP